MWTTKDACAYLCTRSDESGRVGANWVAPGEGMNHPSRTGWPGPSSGPPADSPLRRGSSYEFTRARTQSRWRGGPAP